MTLLISGLAIFFGVHCVPFVAAWRAVLIDRLGEKGYRATFSVVSGVGFVLIIVGKIQAQFVHWYVPPSWGRGIAPILVFVALVLLPAAHMPTNIKRFTRHPMLWGVFLWSVAHLLSNGDLASVLLFGSFGVYALIDMMSANFRGAKLQAEKYPVKKDVIVLVAGSTVYAALLFLHPYLFGAAVI